MSRNDHLEQRLATREVGASTTTAMILPTDIMLGRGPTCYNNQGNKVFRKLIKEHVAHYKNDARRKEKAALVKLLVSKIEAKGYRFLHRSTAGTWVEAPPQVVKNKVGHGLRDARIQSGKVDGDVNVSPKKSRPNRQESKFAFQVVPVITVQPKATEGMRGEESCNMVMITSGDDLKYIAFQALSPGHLVQESPIPKKGQQLIDPKAIPNLNVASDSDLMTHEPIPDKGQQLIDAKASSSLFKDFSFDFMPHEFLHSDGLLEETAMLLFDNESEDCPDHCGSGAHVNNVADQMPQESSTASEMEQGMEDGELSWDDKNDTTVLPGVSPHDAANIMDTLDVALTIYAAFYKGSVSFEDCLAGDPFEPLKYDVDDSQSLSRWLRQSA